MSLDTFLKQTQSLSPLENDACYLLLLDFDVLIETTGNQNRIIYVGKKAVNIDLFIEIPFYKSN